MRRIVVIAAGMEGLRAAARIKRRLFEHEINVIVPSALENPPKPEGPVGERHAAQLPNLELLVSREVGVLDAHDIMPDLDEKELTISSSRGTITIRYSDLVLEIPALARLPRPLQRCANVFAWPYADFAADPRPCDKALAEAADADAPALVVGDGPAALDAAVMACQAGVRVIWLRTGEQECPALDPHLAALAVKRLWIELPVPGSVQPDSLAFDLDGDGTRLETVRLGDAVLAEHIACCFWTAPLMARHPILREPGIHLTPGGSITAEPEDAARYHLSLMGTGALVSGAALAASGAVMPACPGGHENAKLSGLAALDTITGNAPAPGKGKNGAFGVRRAGAPGMRLIRAGLTAAEAARQSIDTEHALVSRSREEAPGISPSAEWSGAENALLALSLVCDKKSRTLVGVQVLGLGVSEAAVEGVFGMAFAALADETPVSALFRRAGAGDLAALTAEGAAVLCNKLDTIIQGINPGEFLASRDAGAEFFTLDLRSMPDWRGGHVPGAYNIPLPQLKKRIQDEVPRFTPIVLVSSDGRDAYAVACRMAGLGATSLYVLDGGMRLWPYEEEKGSV